MTYSGPERRKMNDNNELLARIDERTKNIDEKLDTQTTIIKEHIIEDKKQWERIDGVKLQIAKWTGIGTGAGSIVGFIISKLLK